MSMHFTAETLAEAQAQRRNSPFEVRVGRTFDLPPVLHAATVGLYLAFLAVMAMAFQDRGLILPMAIFVMYIVMAFGVPALWVRMRPEHDSKAIGWSEFVRDGIATNSGRLSAADATGQVLMLPVLIFGWGIGIAAIVATIG